LIIRDVQHVTPLVRTFVLESADGSPLPAFEPGAHIKVRIPGQTDPRCYSLIGIDRDPAVFSHPSQYRLGVRLDDAGTGGSRYMHSLQVGDTLYADGPKNDFPLDAGVTTGQIILVAGGIGITPIASMAAALVQANRSFVLHYCGRTRTQLSLVDELESLLPGQLHLHLDDEPSGLPDIQSLLDRYQPDDHLYVCGPQGMIDAMVAGARARQWPDSQVHVERFTTAAAQAGDHAFEVELRQSGMVLTVPADQTIFEAMEAAGCDPMVDCKRGECGVCLTTVIEGTPDHRDYCLSESEKAEGKVIHICISRAKSARLVLDA